MKILPYIYSTLIWLIVFVFSFLALLGCTTAPLSVLPEIGDKLGADEIKCQYERKNRKYSLDCTLHDEGEIK